MSNEALFEVRELDFAYGARRDAAAILRLESLDIQRGQRVALIGPNGSGKTSLLKLLNALALPRSGRVLFEGEEARLSSSLRRRSVYLHQHPFLFAGSVSYNVGFGCARLGLSRDEREERVARALARVGLAGFARRRHRALSGGEAQRVALARALATGADVFLLDEPTASADAASAELIVKVLDEEAARGATIVIATHEKALSEGFATRVIRLEGGRLADDSGAIA